ncbi:hypothetical protein [Bradyrhizobium sp. JR3.5]
MCFAKTVRRNPVSTDALIEINVDKRLDRHSHHHDRETGQDPADAAIGHDPCNVFVAE